MVDTAGAEVTAGAAVAAGAGVSGEMATATGADVGTTAGSAITGVSAAGAGGGGGRRQRLDLRAQGRHLGPHGLDLRDLG